MGKHKYIKTPEEMWELFVKYVTWCNDNPVEVQDYVGGAGKQVTRVNQRPLTMSGFRAFSHKQGVTIVHYFSNTDKAYNDYRTICSRIEDEIRNEQIVKGLLGIYNPSITQRLNNLKEQTETTNSHNVNLLNIDPLDDSTDNSTKKDS